jgi:hypothetical protein
MARLTLAFVALLFLALPAQVALGGTTTGCGTVLIASSAWLGGQGVDVKSNGTGWIGSCKGGSANWGWQCVDLAYRLYAKFGWGRIYAAENGGAANGGAAYIPEGSTTASLQFHANGTFAPMPGDLIIESPARANAYYGHVAVVDTVVGATINAVEQNTQHPVGNKWIDNPRHTYTLHGLSISGGYAPVRGVMHSLKNHLSQPAPAAPTPQPTPSHARAIGWGESASVVPTAHPAATPAPAGGIGAAAIAAAAAAIAHLATPAPAAGVSFRLTSTVNVRAGPGTLYHVIGSLPAGRAVTMVCQAHGTSVNGSTIWDQLSTGGWVTDYYVNTPGFNVFAAGIRRC